MNRESEECTLSLQDFVSKPYPLIIRENQNKFYIFIPKLHIFVESDTLQSAYDLCKKEKISFYNRLEFIESLHLIPPLSDVPTLRKRIDLQKIVIERFCSFVLTFVFWIFLLLIVGHQLNKSTVKINEALSPTGPEQSEKRLERFKEKIKVVAPYMREIKKAFNE